MVMTVISPHCSAFTVLALINRSAQMKLFSNDMEFKLDVFLLSAEILRLEPIPSNKPFKNTYEFKAFPFIKI